MNFDLRNLEGPPDHCHHEVMDCSLESDKFGVVFLPCHLPSCVALGTYIISQHLMILSCKMEIIV